MEQQNLFRFSAFKLPKLAKLRMYGVYTAGACYAIGFWSMMDAAMWSKLAENASDVHVTFVDWIPFICSTLGMLVVNSIERGNLMDTNNSFMGGSQHAWAARVILFFGFALLAGGLAGSLMTFIIKFISKHISFPTLGMGVSNVVSNAFVMLLCIILWVSQNIEDEYSYSLAL